MHRTDTEKNGTSPCVRVEAHGLNWRAVRDFADELEALDINKVRNPHGEPGVELVKDSLYRTVVRMASPSEGGSAGVFVKRIKLDRFGRRLKALVRGTQAAREWKVSRAMIRRGIPTSRVLAMAENRDGLFCQEAFLISRELPNAVTVRNYLKSIRGSRDAQRRRRELVEEMASLLVRMIDRGIGHGDLHVGNVMINPNAPRGERLYVLDVHRVKVGGPGRRGIIRMMVYLADSTSQLGVGPLERLRFLRRVLRAWRGRAADEGDRLRRWARRVERAWKRRHRRHMRSRTKRCVEQSSEFTCGRSGGFRIYRRRCFPVDKALEAVRGHLGTDEGAESGCDVRKDGPRTKISRCVLSSGREIFIKAFKRDSLWDRVKGVFRPKGRAMKAWIAHRGLEVRGIPQARALCLLESNNKLGGEPDYLITEAVEGGTDLQELARGQSPNHPRHEELCLSDMEIRALGESVAGLFRDMAAARVRHGDMKPSNIVVGIEKDEFGLSLVDLDSVKFEEEWKRRHWVLHLAQCNAGLDAGISPLQRMRSLRTIGRNRWTASERLSIAREVLEMSMGRDPMWLR